MNALTPLPKLPIAVRLATAGDLPFIDALQKKHERMVGWMPMKQLEEKVSRGEIVIAEEKRDQETERRRDEVGENASAHFVSSSLCLSVSPSTRLSISSSPLGYAIFSDRYFKRDDVGIVYALNVVPGKQRSLIGATLLKAVFERAAYGCRLFCCWCAQDIEANKFWEAMGFVALAFRTGGRGRGKMLNAEGRMQNEIQAEGADASVPFKPQSEIRNPQSRPPRTHIFWQKRIVAGDVATPWWFPSQTSGGSIREDRLVLPIPPGVRWSDAMPEVLPEGERGMLNAECGMEEKALARRSPAGELGKPKPAVRKTPPPTSTIAMGGLRFETPAPAEPPRPPEPVKPGREKRASMKHDPKLKAAARELRDRWLERINAPGATLNHAAKYEVSKQIQESSIGDMGRQILPAA